MPFNHRDDGVRKKTRWRDLLKAIARLATTQSGKKKVFISYAWYDGDKTTDANIRLHRWLSQLQDDLELCGFQVFLDLLDMHGMMLDKMQSEVEASDGSLIICTPRLKERSTVLDSNLAFELSHILTRSTQLGNAYHMIPLRYEGEFATSVPDCLNTYLVRDFTANDVFTYEAGLLDLMNPLGVVPALLGIRRGHPQYEKL
jgi:hypothetical protein